MDIWNKSYRGTSINNKKYICVQKIYLEISISIYSYTINIYMYINEYIVT